VLVLPVRDDDDDDDDDDEWGLKGELTVDLDV